MLRSMYSGVTGMKGFQTKLDVIGNNIANVNTIGFKKSRMTFQDLLSQNLNSSGVNPMQVGLGSTVSTVDVIHNSGSIMTTGVGTDLAILGDGFFVVGKPDSGAAEGTVPQEKYLTRAGNFVLDAEGNLVTPQGYNVLGVKVDEDGNKLAEVIKIDPETYSSFRINNLGEVIAKDRNTGEETTIATIGVVTPPNPAGLNKVGGSLYEMSSIADGNDGIISVEEISTPNDAKTQITSGQLEMSNVDLTEEFTEMIVAQRGFQANSRVITTSDEILQEVVNLKR